MAVAHSVCPLDCPDRCSLSVEVVDGRVASIDGSHRSALTAGVICAKVRGFGARVHGPRRLLQPMVRVGPKGPGATFRPVSWDEALDLVAARWREEIAAHGPETLLPYAYGGSNGMLTQEGLDHHLWATLGATRLRHTLCAANTSAGTKLVYHGLPSSDPADLGHARLGVLWGVNPSVSGIHLVEKARQVRRAGGRLVVVDPRRTPLARQADLHLRPLPGTDVPLALAVAHVAFRDGLADLAFLERWAEDTDAFRAAVAPWTPEAAAAVCDVPADDIVTLARWWGETRPAFLRAGWGLERNRNGTDSARAVLALPAVFGAFGERGAGFAMSTSGGYRMDGSRWMRPYARDSRTLNMTELGRLLAEVDDPPIRAVYVYNCNPVATVPDQERVMAELARPERFVVVHEQVHTDTCDWADVLLPATTFLEHEELSRSYGGYALQWAEPVIPPVGEARSNHRVAADLAARLGLEDPAFAEAPATLAARIAETVPPERLVEPGPVFPRLVERGIVPLIAPVQFVDATPTRKLTLASPPITYRPPPFEPERPLILVSPASRRAITSTLLEDLPPGSAAVDLHPDDAAARGITDGSRVRVFNGLGEVHVLARVTDELRPGVVSLVKGLWLSATLNGRTATALAPAHVDELGGGACYNDARVDVALL